MLPLRGGSTWNLSLTREELNTVNGNGKYKSIAGPALEASWFYMKRWRLLFERNSLCHLKQSHQLSGALDSQRFFSILVPGSDGWA